MLQQAAIARDLGIEYLALGQSLGYLTRLNPARWATLIAAVRGIGYTGKIIYFGFVTPAKNSIEWEGADPGFAPLLDVVGVYVPDGVLAAAGEVLSKAQTRARMRADLRTMLSRVNARMATPKPIFLLLATPSVHGGVSTSEYIEPCCVNTISVAPYRTRDYQQQADMYQAAAEVINEQPLGNGQVMGFFSWGYTWTDGLELGTNQGDAAFDKSGNVHGKPAEAVLSWWFHRW